MTTRDCGKGDRQRPLTVPKEQFEANWDAIFKKPSKLTEKIVKQVQDSIENANQDWDSYEYLCPNCVSPWKCNGPHRPYEPEEEIKND